MKEVSLSGVVTSIVGNQIMFKTRSAAVYRAETGQAALVRKNGAIMKLEEVEKGDRVQVKGKLWPDNSLNATYVRNMSLYAHNSTFKGKITAINPTNSSFTITGRQHGTQTVHTNPYTEFKINTGVATFKNLQLGMTVYVKGIWERTSTVVAAQKAHANLRLLNITVVGELKMTSPTALTVVGENNVIYGVDITKAKLLNKKGRRVKITAFQPGHRVRAKGKHTSESVQIFAAEVKNLSV